MSLKVDVVRGLRSALAVLWFCVVAWPSVGLAQVIALESNVGERPRGSAAVYAQLWRMLPRTWVTDPAQLVHLLRAHLPAAGQANPRYTGEAFVREIKNAGAVWSRADFEGAQRLLTAAIKNARANPVVLVQDVEARAAMREGLMLLALVQWRMGAQATDAIKFTKKLSEQARLADEARRWSWLSFETIAEVVRSFPGMPVTRDEFGGEAERRYLDVAVAMAQLPAGTLEIEFAEPVGMLVLSVNEMPRAPGLIPKLAPGTYRVLVQGVGGRREYRVEVKSGERARLRIDWRVDATLVAESWIGMRWPTAALQVDEPEVARRLVADKVASQVATFAVEPAGRRYAVTGALYAGAAVRRARVMVDSGQGAPLQRLVDFLERGQRVEGLEVLADSMKSAVVTSSVAPRTLPTPAAAADQREAGLAHPAIAHPRPRRVLPAALIGLGTGAVIFGGVLYYYGSQPPPEMPTNQATLFGSKPAGIATGLAGLAAIGAGWWLLSRPVTPVVSVQGDGGTVGVGAAW